MPAMSHFTPFSLVGLIALADLDMVARRTAFGGTSAWPDTLVLCPGLHRRHEEDSLQRQGLRRDLDRHRSQRPERNRLK